MTNAYFDLKKAIYLAIAGQPNCLITDAGSDRAVRAVLEALLPPAQNEEAILAAQSAIEENIGRGVGFMATALGVEAYVRAILSERTEGEN